MTVVVVTGANKGIGLALCRAFHARGDEVMGVCRQGNAALRMAATSVVEHIELEDEQCGERLSNALGDASVDLMIHNAGLYASQPLGQLDFAQMQREYTINALSPLRLTQACLPKLRASAKLVFISSRAGSLADNRSGDYYGYRMSKAALNMAALSLSHDLRARGIAVLVLHPGVVWTDMLRGAYEGVEREMRGVTIAEPDVAAAELVARIDELDLAGSGRFLHRDGRPIPW